MEKSTFKLVAVLLGIAASLLAVLAIAVYEGFLPEVDVDSLTSGNLGALSALAAVGAIGVSYMEKNG